MERFTKTPELVTSEKTTSSESKSFTEKEQEFIDLSTLLHGVIAPFQSYYDTKLNDTRANKVIAVKVLLDIFKNLQAISTEQPLRYHYLFVNLLVQFLSNTDITGAPIHQYSHKAQTGTKGLFSSFVDSTKNTITDRLVFNDIGTLIPELLTSIRTLIKGVTIHCPYKVEKFDEWAKSSHKDSVLFYYDEKAYAWFACIITEQRKKPQKIEISGGEKHEAYLAILSQITKKNASSSDTEPLRKLLFSEKTKLFSEQKKEQYTSTKLDMLSEKPTEQDVIQLTKQLNELLTSQSMAVSKKQQLLDSANLFLFGKALYYHMTRAKQNATHDEKIIALNDLVYTCFEYSIKNEFNPNDVFALIEKAKLCIHTSKQEGSGTRGIDLEMIAADYIDQVVKALLDKGDLNTDYKDLLNRVTSDGCMSVYAYDIASKLGMNQQDQLYFDITESIFNPDVKSNSRPFDLTIYLLKHAAQISNSLNYLLKKGVSVGINKIKLAKYAHLFNCAIYSHLKTKHGKTFDQKAHLDKPYCDYLIEPALYQEKDIPENLATEYKNYFNKEEIISKSEINKVYVKLNKKPFNPKIGVNFSKTTAKLANNHPFSGAYQLINELAYARYFANSHLHSDVDEFTWIVDILFKADFKSHLIDYAERINLLGKINFDRNNVNLTSFTALCNALVDDSKNFLPEKYHDSDSMQSYSNGFEPQFPYTDDHRNQIYDMHIEEDIIRTRGPGKKADEEGLGDLFTIFNQFFDLKPEQRPWAILAMGQLRHDFFPYPCEIGKPSAIRLDGTITRDKDIYHITLNISIKIIKDDIGLKYTVTKNNDKFEIYLFNLHMEDNTGFIIDPTDRKILQAISVVNGPEEVASKWGASIFGNKPIPEKPIMVHCASGVGRTGTEALYRRAVKFCKAVIAVDSSITKLKQQTTIDEKNFQIIAGLLKPFGIDDKNYNNQIDFVFKILNAVESFKLGMIKIIQGESLNEEEFNALDLVFSRILHDLRQIRYSIQQQPQFDSALKEIAIYYAETAGLKASVIEEFDLSVILGPKYCSFTEEMSLNVAHTKSTSLAWSTPQNRKGEVLLPITEEEQQTTTTQSLQ